MDFTPLHRALGRQPSDLTNELLDEAVAEGLVETDDLDWKEEFPPSKGLSKTDVPKDIAAMANRGGGMIIYGVKEDQKKAIERAHIDDFDENYERTYRSVAITAITPPVFGLDIRVLGKNPMAVAVIVPPSVDGPHLIYKDNYFGAPIRNDADTAWMKESQIETMYKARFDERRRSDEALESLYAETVNGKNTDERAWFIAVARPRIATVAKKMEKEDAKVILDKAINRLKSFSPSGYVSPLDRSIDRFNLRQGLRKWIAPSSVSHRGNWSEASAEIYYDGSVTFAAGVGGFPYASGLEWKGNEVEVRAIERDVTEFLYLLRESAAALSNDDYEVCVGIEVTTEDRLIVFPFDRMFNRATQSGAVDLVAYTPLISSVNARTSDEDFYRQVYQIIEDCVNQCGISELTTLRPPRDTDE